MPPFRRPWAAFHTCPHPLPVAFQACQLCAEAGHYVQGSNLPTLPRLLNMYLPSLFREFSETCVKLNYFISTEDVRGVVTHRIATMDEAAGLTVGGVDWGKIVRLSLAVQPGKDQ